MIFNIIDHYIKHKTFPRFSSTLAMFSHAQAITSVFDIPFHCDLFLILICFQDVEMLGKRKSSNCETGQVFSPQEKPRERITISPRWRIWKLDLCATLTAEYISSSYVGSTKIPQRECNSVENRQTGLFHPWRLLYVSRTWGNVH